MTRFLPLSMQAALLGAMGPAFDTDPEGAEPEGGVEVAAPADEGGQGGKGYLDVIKEGAAELRAEQEAKRAQEEAELAGLSAEDRAAAAAAKAARQPRGEDGKFAPKEPRAAEEEEEEAEPGAGEEEEVEEEPGEELADELEEEEVEEELEEEEAPAARTVKLPGRRPGDPDEEWELPEDAAELAEGINRLRNGYRRTEEYEAVMRQVADREAELEAIEDGIATDPVGYLTSQVPAEIRRDVVRAALLQDDELFEELMGEAAEWEADPRARELAKERAKNQAREIRDQASQARHRAKTITKAKNEIVTSVRGLIPDDMPTERAERFHADALRDIQDYLRRNPTRVLSGAQAVKLLEQNGRLAMYGLTPRRPGADAPSRSNGKTPQAARDRRGSPRADDRMEKARGTGKRLKEKAARRKAAAGVAPAGAGTPSAARTRPPEGQSVKDRIDWARKKWTGRGS